VRACSSAVSSNTSRFLSWPNWRFGSLTQRVSRCCSSRADHRNQSATRELSVYGVEQKEGTVPLAKMNLALHGLSGDIRLANSYYDNPHGAVGAFDFVMANPPFNVDKDKLAGDPRFPYASRRSRCVRQPRVAPVGRGSLTWLLGHGRFSPQTVRRKSAGRATLAGSVHRLQRTEPSKYKV
jgi:hypothetical protein